MLCLIPIVGGLLIMMGQHDRSEALFYYFRLEDQFPENPDYVNNRVMEFSTGFRIGDRIPCRAARKAARSFRMKNLALLLVAMLWLSIAAPCQGDLFHLRLGAFPQPIVRSNAGEQVSNLIPPTVPQGFVIFSVPGSTSTTPSGVNNLGQIVGFFDSSGVTSGFLFDVASDTFTTIDYPGAVDTLATGINDGGAIVGYYSDVAGLVHGFIEQSAVYTDISYPGTQVTVVNGINDRGDIVGYYLDPARNEHGFLYTGGAYIKLDVPGAIATALGGINYAREIAGTYCKSPCTGASGFVYSRGTFTDINYPGAATTAIDGLNDHGDLAGGYEPGPQGQFQVDLIYRNRTQMFVGFDVGLSDNTAALGINDSGEIVGYLIQVSTPYGFYRLPKNQP